MAAYISWLTSHTGHRFDRYVDLQHWSVNELDTFWCSIWDYFAIASTGHHEGALTSTKMPGARWFEGERVSFVEHVFRHAREDRPAIIARSESIAHQEISWADLEAKVAAVAAWLRDEGVGPGDRVVGYLPNVSEAVVACLAATSLGAIWSCCSPDFGVKSVIDRFRQIAPKVLFACDGYRYGGVDFNRLGVVAEIEKQLPTLERVVIVPVLAMTSNDPYPKRRSYWSEVVERPAKLELPRFDFSHPLWIVYTSGTTGLPKPIVHSQGGVLLEMLKGECLHLDVGSNDTFFWFSTTGWIMWNIVLGALLTGATIVLYDGNPGHPDLDVLWRLAADFQVTLLGTSAAFLTSCMKAGLEPGSKFNLSHLRTVGSTGSPLSPSGFDWVYQNVKRDVWLAPISGGTDIATAFVGACPLLPVHSGEMQCRYLGVDAQAFDQQGQPVINSVGELVVTQPMPSMPVCLWNDTGNARYLDSYFAMYPGVWRHGDFVMFTDRETAIIYGRSDSTINRGGVRFGTSDIYDVIERLPEITDSLVVDVDTGGDRTEVVLFVALANGADLTPALVERLKSEIRRQLSPRHVPDQVLVAPAIPRTLNGKKLEVPVKRLLTGSDVESAVSQGATANPQALEYFVRLGREWSARQNSSPGDG